MVLHSRSDSEGLFHINCQTQVIISPSSVTPVFFLPAAFVLYILSAVFYHPGFYLMPRASYGIAGLFSGASIAIKNKSPSAGLAALFLYPLLHISYGTGIIAGLSKRFDPKLKYKTPVIKLKKIKSFNNTKWEL